MKSKQRLGIGLALAGLACVAATACGGDSKDGSLLDMQDGNGASSTTGATANGDGGADSSIHLGLGGGAADGPSGGDTNGLGDGGACGSTRFEGAPQAVNVLLVVDKSLSMEDKPTGFASSKWTALRGALADTFKQTEAKIAFGLDLFPYSGKSGQMLANSCQMPSAGAAVVVPVQDGTLAAPLILAALDANPPSGGTPTAAALERAYVYFATGPGKSLVGEKYVLLATDGGPNCNDKLTCTIATCTVNMDGKPGNLNYCDPKLDPLGPTNCLDQDASVAAVTELLGKAGVKTIVVGIPGTEAYADTLNALAAESGVTNPDAPPSYFAVSAQSGAPGLSAALQSVTTGLVKSCELHLGEEPPDRKHLFVVIDGVELTEDDPDGWTIPDPDPKHTPPVIEITGAACQKLETTGAEYINITYGCPDLRPPIK